MLNFGNATRRVAASAIALTFISAPAFGADPPAHKSQQLALPPAFTWTGLYVGFNFSHTWTGSNPINTRTVNLVDSTLAGFGPISALGANGVVGARLDGFLSGGQIGYNWQFTDNFVVGLEADVSGAGVRGGGGFGSIVANGPASDAVTSATLRRSLEYLGTVRGRLGYAVAPNILVYATGGLAFGGANQTLTLQQTLVPSALVARTVKGDQYDNLVGWTVGGGAEMALSRALSARLEYLYYDLGQLSLSGAIPLVNASATSTSINGHLLRLGVNYRFDWSVPETASRATPLFARDRVFARWSRIWRRTLFQSRRASRKAGHVLSQWAGQKKSTRTAALMSRDFAFTSFGVVEPFIVYTLNRISDDEGRLYLDRYETRLRQFDQARVLPMAKIVDERSEFG